MNSRGAMNQPEPARADPDFVSGDRNRLRQPEGADSPASAAAANDPVPAAAGLTESGSEGEPGKRREAFRHSAFLTCEQLETLLAERTETEVEQLLRAFGDITVTGELGIVQNAQTGVDGSVLVPVGPAPNRDSVSCFVDSRYISALAALPKHGTVAMRGRCGGVEAGKLKLVDCDLLLRVAGG